LSEALANPAVNSAGLGAIPATHRAVQSGARTAGASWRRTQRLLIDIVTLVSAAAISSIHWRQLAPADLLWQSVFIGFVLVSFVVRGAYASRLRVEFIEDLRGIVTGTGVAAMATLTAQLVFDGGYASTSVMARQWFLAACYVAAGRTGARLTTIRAARRGEMGSPTLIVGAGKVGQTVASRFLARPELGVTPVGFLDKEPLVDGDVGLPVLGASWDLEEVVHAHGIENVVLAFSTAPTEVVLDVVRRCDRLGVTVSHVPRLFESVNGTLAIDHLGGIPLVTRRAVNPRDWRFVCKYAFERVLAVFVLIFFMPVFALLALAVWFSVGSPVLFRQTRIGRDGRPFDMLKFRSMRQGGASLDDVVPEGPDTAPGGVEGDDRRTKVGRFMRRSSLDELPQVLNVIKGEMSFVGPRPERPRFVDMFQGNIYRYSDRHRVKVGMTGWAQIHGLRGKTSLADRVEWDNYYIENWSPWLDVKTILLTFGALLRTRDVVE
jgi:exopolysaccharide biosynthesis polyprenyl glycosylphosphotransferase